MNLNTDVKKFENKENVYRRSPKANYYVFDFNQ